MSERSIWNYTVEVEGKKEIKVPVLASEIATTLSALVNPQRLLQVGGRLHAVDPKARRAVALEKPDRLFGWIQSCYVNVYWSVSSGCITKGEFLDFLGRTVPERDAIRTLPHYPPLAGIEYLCEPGMGEEGLGALEELVDFWRSYTPYDRALMMAAFCTPFWGGPGGTRPAISIESDGADDGRAVGKSQLMYAIANVAGGHIDGSLKDDVAGIKKRILTDGAHAAIIAFDNCKTSRLSSGDLEGLITAPKVSGWRPYFGNAEVANLFTYIFTMNDAAFSADMSSRSVRIILSRHVADQAWQGRLEAFLSEHRAEIINDCIFYLKGAGRQQASHIRFARWQYEVLSHIDGSDEIARLMKARQDAVNADEEASEDLSGAIQHKVSEHARPGLNPYAGVHLDPEKDSVLITREVMCDWLRLRFGRHTSSTAITQMLKRARIPQLTSVIGGADIKLHGVRYWLWTPTPGARPAAAWKLSATDTRQPAKEYRFLKTAGFPSDGDGHEAPGQEALLTD